MSLKEAGFLEGDGSDLPSLCRLLGGWEGLSLWALPKVVSRAVICPSSQQPLFPGQQQGRLDALGKAQAFQAVGSVSVNGGE